MSDIFDKDRAISLMKRIFDVIQESGCTHAEAYNAILWVEAAYTGFMGEKYVELARKWREDGLAERLSSLHPGEEVVPGPVVVPDTLDGDGEADGAPDDGGEG